MRAGDGLGHRRERRVHPAVVLEASRQNPRLEHPAAVGPRQDAARRRQFTMDRSPVPGWLAPQFRVRRHRRRGKPKLGVAGQFGGSLASSLGEPAWTCQATRRMRYGRLFVQAASPKTSAYLARNWPVESVGSRMTCCSAVSGWFWPRGMVRLFLAMVPVRSHTEPHSGREIKASGASRFARGRIALTNGGQKL